METTPTPTPAEAPASAETPYDIGAVDLAAQSYELTGATIAHVNANAPGVSAVGNAVRHIAVYAAQTNAALVAALHACAAAHPTPLRVEERYGPVFDPRETAIADLVVVPSTEAFARAVGDAYATRGIPSYAVPSDGEAFATSPIAASLADALGVAVAAFVFPAVEAPVAEPTTEPTTDAPADPPTDVPTKVRAPRGASAAPAAA